MRRLLLGVALLALAGAPVASSSPPSVAAGDSDCYYYDVDIPPYGNEVRVCPPSPNSVKAVLPDL